MADKGKIYWVLEPGVQQHSGQYELYISGEPFTVWDYTGTLWNQNSSATIPWSSKMSSIFQVNLIGDINANNYAGWFKNATSLTAITNQGYYGPGPYAFCNGNSYKEMFYGCSALTIDNTYGRGGMFKPGSEAVDASYMFYGNTGMTTENSWYTLGLENAVITNASHMFQNCSNATNPVSIASDIFFYTNSIEEIGSSKAVPTDVSYMFAGCSSMIYNAEFIQEFNWQNCTNMSYMFDGCTSLHDIWINWNDRFTSKVTNMSYMFRNCSSMVYAHLEFLRTESVTDMSYMFSGCTSLISVFAGGWIFDSIKNTTSMFDGCSQLASVYVRQGTDLTGSGLTSSTNMFRNCSAIVGENGTRYSSSYTNKSRAVLDADGKPGYFRLHKISIEKYVTGNGQIVCDESYPYGSTATIQFVPNTNYYIDSADVGFKSIIDSRNPTPNKYTYVFSAIFAQESIDVDATFKYRDTHTVTIFQEGTSYSISGAGTYRYLDNPILVVDMNEGGINFLGWYYGSGSQLISKQNPYSFIMPDRDYSITARFGEPPFTDEKVRQFVLSNGNSEIYALTSKDSPLFLNKPTGLGYSKQLSTVRYGDSEDVQAEQFDMPKPKGSVFFYSSDIETVYKEFNEFVRFTMRKPFTLWYKIPVGTKDNVYHLPVEITSLEKSETNEIGALEAGIEFYGTSFWKQTGMSEPGSNTIFNDGDLDVGVEITAAKSDNTSFTNPVITFSISNVDDSEYGLIAFEGTFTKIYVNTKDKDQKIILYNGSDTPLDSPFKYLNFQHSKVDGTRVFPYPKLKNGKITKIDFSYDGKGSEATNVLVVYDKEYVSV